MITIRALNASDLETADRIMQSAFGTPDIRREELNRYLNLQPDGWLLAEVDGLVVGMVGAVDYGPFAWIGFMAVLPEMQRRGIGRALMEQILSWLEGRGCPMARLDATDAGAALYHKLGFEAEGQALLFARPEPVRASSSPDKVYPFEAAEFPAVVELDESIFGARRELLLKAVLAAFPGRAFLTRDEAGRVSGYLVAQSQKIGPWAARTPEDASVLLSAASRLSFDGIPRVIFPSENIEAVKLLVRSGFVQKQPHLHMRLGGTCLPGQRQLLYGQVSYAVG